MHNGVKAPWWRHGCVPRRLMEVRQVLQRARDGKVSWMMTTEDYLLGGSFLFYSRLDKRIVFGGRKVIMRRFWISRAMFLTVLICQMLTANSCNGIFPDLCGWYIFRKSLSHSTPKHRYKAGSFSLSNIPMLLPVWSIEADLVDFTKVLSAYGKTHRWSATLHGLTALDSSTLSAETLMW